MLINKSVSNPLVTPATYQIFSTDPDPTKDKLGGLTIGNPTKRYNCVYGNGTPACFTVGELLPSASSNWLIFSDAPVIEVWSTTATSIYGNDPSVAGVKVTRLTGYIDGDSTATAGVSISGGVVFTTDATNTSDVNSGTTITYVSGLLSAMGYQFATVPGSAAAYIITPRSVELSTINIASKIYDNSTAATISSYGSLLGVLYGDNVYAIGGVATFDSPIVATHKTVTITDVGLGGSKAEDYYIVGSVFTSYADINVLANNFIGSGSSGGASASSSASSASSSSAASSTAKSSSSSSSSGGGDLTVDSSGTNGGTGNVSSSADASYVTVSLPSLAGPTSVLDDSSSTAGHLTITAPSGFLVKSEEARKGSIGDERVEVNAFVARQGLGVRIASTPKSGAADPTPEEHNSKPGD